MNTIDKEKQEKEKQIVADVWNLHIIEVSLFLNIISKLCSFSPVPSRNCLRVETRAYAYFIEIPSIVITITKKRFKERQGIPNQL